MPWLLAAWLLLQTCELAFFPTISVAADLPCRVHAGAPVLVPTHILPRLPPGQVAERDRCVLVHRVRGRQGECRGIGDRAGVVRFVRSGEVWCRWRLTMPRLSSRHVAKRDRRACVRRLSFRAVSAACGSDKSDKLQSLNVPKRVTQCAGLCGVAGGIRRAGWFRVDALRRRARRSVRPLHICHQGRARWALRTLLRRAHHRRGTILQQRSRHPATRVAGHGGGQGN